MEDTQGASKVVVCLTNNQEGGDKCGQIENVNLHVDEDTRRRIAINRMEARKKLAANGYCTITREMSARIEANRTAAKTKREKLRCQRNRERALELLKTNREKRRDEVRQKLRRDKEDEQNEKMAVMALEKYESECFNDARKCYISQDMNPLEIPEILEHVFMHLTIDELLSYRDVNSDWREEAVRAIVLFMKPLEEFDLYVTDPQDPDFGHRRI